MWVFESLSLVYWKLLSVFKLDEVQKTIILCTMRLLEMKEKLARVIC